MGQTLGLPSQPAQPAGLQCAFSRGMAQPTPLKCLGRSSVFACSFRKKKSVFSHSIYVGFSGF